jgi:hypothetical protein
LWTDVPGDARVPWRDHDGGCRLARLAIERLQFQREAECAEVRLHRFESYVADEPSPPCNAPRAPGDTAGQATAAVAAPVNWLL